MRPTACSLAALLAALAASGCYNSYQVPVPELYKLNGFRAGDKLTLLDGRGQALRFDKATELTVQLVDGSERRFSSSSVDIANRQFASTPYESEWRFVVGPPKPQVKFDLMQATSVNVKNLDRGKTYGYGLGFGLGIPLTIAGGLPAVAVAAFSACSDC